jgi:hypothetical protein
MAKQAKELILETKNDFARLQEELESAKKTRDEYNRLLTNARRRLERRENDDYPTKIALGYIEALKAGNIPETTLIKEIDTATETNKEFDDRTYKLYLYKVANTKDIYKFITNGSGWGTRFDVQIIFEAEAGDINDWAEGVDSYRTVVLKSKGLNNEKAGEKASEWWYDNVYGSELNTKTITGRLALVTKGVAPFWRILNSGTVPMGSDREGGYTLVSNSPTDFVGKAERILEQEFLTFMRDAQEKRFQESKEIREIVEAHEAKRDQYSDEVSRLKTEMKLNEQIIKSFKDKAEYIDKDILAKAISLMDSDERIKTRQVNIAKAGSGQKLFITIKKLEGTIEI